MLVAYTAEKAPFLYKDENGELTGFDVELFKNAFDSFKGDYKNYEFVQVPEGYKLGEDAAYTDENGKTIVEAVGRSAHGSTPHLGVNAAILLLNAVKENEFG